MSFLVGDNFLCKIIEQNTDIFSVFHYESVDLLTQKDNLTYWTVREISSGKVSVINANKWFILPFDNYRTVEATVDGKNIVCYRNQGKKFGYIDSSGNIVIPVIYDNLCILACCSGVTIIRFSTLLL